MGRVRYSVDWGCLLTILGGVVIVAEALLFLASTPFAAIGFALGGVFVGLGVTVRRSGARRAALDGAIALVALLGLIDFGLFLFGSALAIIGGIVVLTTRSSGFVTRPSSSFDPGSLGPPCPRCGHRIPTRPSKCPYCGYPDV